MTNRTEGLYLREKLSVCGFSIMPGTWRWRIQARSIARSQMIRTCCSSGTFPVGRRNIASATFDGVFLQQLFCVNKYVCSVWRLSLAGFRLSLLFFAVEIHRIKCTYLQVRVGRILLIKIPCIALERGESSMCI